MSPLICSVSVGTIGKQCIKNDKYLYTYRADVKKSENENSGGIKIPPLGMVDDVASVALCGVDSVEMNAYLNTKTNLKKLQFGASKCKKMHVGQNSAHCPDLYIDKWKLKQVSNIHCSINDFEDVEDGEIKMESSIKEKYLGMILEKDGSNKANIQARISRGHAAINEIMMILEENYFGSYYFEVFSILRQSLFVNSVLSNSASWYNWKAHDVQKLLACEAVLMKRGLSTNNKTSHIMMYLELGWEPISYLLKSRRLLYLKYILNESNQSLIYNFLRAQWENPLRGDWIITVKDDLKELKLDCYTFDQIRLMSKDKFRSIVNTAVNKAAFQFLIEKKRLQSKISHTILNTIHYRCNSI